MAGTVVVDYDAGNLSSVENALAHLCCDFVTTADPLVVGAAERIIFPGVGGAPQAMRALSERGLVAPIEDLAAAGRPILGLCLGCQVVFDESEEGPTACLGLIPGAARLFPGGGDPWTGGKTRLKVPQMGWNTVRQAREHAIFSGIERERSFYFVHSYYPDPARTEHLLAYTSYGVEFASVVAKGSVVATQFHPEKSGGVGLRLLRNFLDWDGT